MFADIIKFESAILNIKPPESDEDIIEFVEDSYVSFEEALSTLKECIYKCSYAIKSLKAYKGSAYYKLAVHLHAIDGWLRFECGGG